MVANEIASGLQRHLNMRHALFYFSPTAESFGVSAQIGSGVVRGGPEVRFHEGSTRVEVLRGLRGCASTEKSTACCWGYYHLSLRQAKRSTTILGPLKETHPRLFIPIRQWVTIVPPMSGQTTSGKYNSSIPLSHQDHDIQYRV